MPGEAFFIASAIISVKWVPVTKLMLCTPSSCSLRIISASIEESTLVPVSCRLISEFWQYTHFRLQPEKNMAPLPLTPLMQGSSPKCGAALAMNGKSEQPQKPVLFSLSILHFLGHKTQFWLMLEFYSNFNVYSIQFIVYFNIYISHFHHKLRLFLFNVVLVLYKLRFLIFL